MRFWIASSVGEIVLLNRSGRHKLTFTVRTAYALTPYLRLRGNGRPTLTERGEGVLWSSTVRRWLVFTPLRAGTAVREQRLASILLTKTANLNR